MKRIIATVGTLVLAGALVGCGSQRAEPEAVNDQPDTTKGETHVPRFSGTYFQELPDGTKRLCIWAKSGYAGGLSCDWDTIIEGD